jgi:hypothetical protein
MQWHYCTCLIQVPAKHKSILFLALSSASALFVRSDTLIGWFILAAPETQYSFSGDIWPCQRGRQIQQFNRNVLEILKWGLQQKIHADRKFW